MTADDDNAPEPDAVYRHLWDAHTGEGFAILDESQDPRGPEHLFEWVESLRLSSESLALDIGCGAGNFTIEMARRFGFPTIGIDPSQYNVKQADALHKAKTPGLPVQFQLGEMESLPFPEGSFDLLWSRDALNLVSDIGKGFKECARVLRPGGWFILVTTCATDQMELSEAARIFAPLNIVTENLNQEAVETAISDAGFFEVHVEPLGSELMEYYEERDQRMSRELLRLARMLRQPERFHVTLGKGIYDISLALYHWNIYQMLGKLNPTVYLLQAAS